MGLGDEFNGFLAVMCLSNNGKAVFFPIDDVANELTYLDFVVHNNGFNHVLIPPSFVLAQVSILDPFRTF